MTANSSLKTLTPLSLQKEYLDNSRHHTLHNRLEQQSARIKILWILHALCLAPWVVHLRALEYLAHALRTPALITKSKLRTMQCIMLGYATCAKETRVSHGDLPNKQQSHSSTAEAEYVAATTAAQELLFLKTFLTEIGYLINKAITLYSDSQSAIANIKHIQLRHASNKHTDIKLHFPKIKSNLET
ncbi:hypothetical protein BASA83_009546 [Batrachochytrium salamandrivorans]|nr:hypothetical protein BASA83_009546 [Batrachochytrium salamandrivorans]